MRMLDLQVPLRNTQSNKSSQGSSRGLTLIEVVVAIAIVSILLALALPAIHQSRERSRRSTCANNLRQLALALAAHESTHHLYPAAMSQRLTEGMGLHSAFVQLLPYLEQEAVYAAVDTRTPSISTISPNPLSISMNRTAIGTRISLFVCPADERRQLSWPGNTNYALNLGPAPYDVNDDFDEQLYPGAGRGAFAIYKSYGSAAFRDGLDATVALSERLMGDGNAQAFQRHRDIWHPSMGPVTGLSSDEVLSVCSAFSGQYTGMLHFSWQGVSWFYGGYQNTFYNHVAGPNSKIVNCDLLPPPMNGAGSYAARSLHRDGVNAATMGASVRFVNERIDLKSWRAVSTRASGEIVTQF